MSTLGYTLIFLGFWIIKETLLHPEQTTANYAGRITRIDPVSGAQTTWVSDARLGNIDGLAFDAVGDLLVSAIDHLKIHRVNGATKQITEFADLTALGLQGFGSLAVNPSDQSVFVASPKDGDLVHLNADGSLASAALASGFQHMGQLALDGSCIFVSDNVAGMAIIIF